MTIVREARIENLPEIVDYIARASREMSPEAEFHYDLRLAVEELFTNIIRHAYPEGPGPVRVSVTSDARAVTVTVEDQGLPFDPADAPAPDTMSAWEDRPIGGLGWHLVRQCVDEIGYRPGVGGGNVVTLTKHLPGGGAQPE